MAISDCYPDLWADPVAFASDKGISDADDAEKVIEEASWLLWSLTGFRFTSKYQGRKDTYRSRHDVWKFNLAHGPVDDVFTIKRIDPKDDSVTALTNWVDLRGGEIRLKDGNFALDYQKTSFVRFGGRYPLLGDRPRDDTLLEVQYRIKPNLPAGGARAVRKLAYELYLSDSGSGACSLPDRVTSIVRQGITWTILDPMDFLQEKLTGLGSVDQWISAVNNRGYAGITDPITWLELVESEVIGCGEDFEP